MWIHKVSQHQVVPAAQRGEYGVLCCRQIQVPHFVGFYSSNYFRLFNDG